MTRYGVRITTFRECAPQATHYYGSAWRETADGVETIAVETELDHASAARLTELDNAYERIRYRYHAGERTKRFESREALLEAGGETIRRKWGHGGAIEVDAHWYENNSAYRPGSGS